MKPQKTNACATPAAGRSAIVCRCSRTSTTKRLMRKPRSSSEKVFVAAEMMRRRRWVCATNAPTPVRNSSQNARTATSAFERFDHCRNDLEEIAHDSIIGDFEDRRVGILVDRDDGLRALHPDQVLDRARDAERQIQLRRDGLPGA